MANTNTIFGARYFCDPFGGSASGKLLPFVFDSGDGTAAFVGDLVTLTGDSELSEFPQLGYLPIVTQAAAGSTHLVGVIEGFGVDPDNLTKIYRPASTLKTAWVNVNPFAFFKMQSSGTFVSADVGQCAKITVGAGSAITGLSGMQLDHGTLTGSADQLKIVGVAPDSELGAYTKVLVQINLHTYKITTGV